MEGGLQTRAGRRSWVGFCFHRFGGMGFRVWGVGCGVWGVGCGVSGVELINHLLQVGDKHRQVFRNCGSKSPPVELIVTVNNHVTHSDDKLPIGDAV